MILVIDISCLSQGPDDQGLSCGPGCHHRQGMRRLASYGKADLVHCLIWHFERARAAATRTPAQLKAREWLPDAMLFPAVDPDAPIAPEDDGADAPWADAT
jgi:hypothetical protein